MPFHHLAQIQGLFGGKLLLLHWEEPLEAAASLFIAATHSFNSLPLERVVAGRFAWPSW